VLAAVTPGGSCFGASAETDPEEITLTLRAAIRANNLPIFVAGNREDAATTSGSTACGKVEHDSLGERAAVGATFLISLTMNLWSGDRREEVTVNRAPLFEHRNSTSLNSTVSG